MFSNILPQIGVEIKNFIESAPSITAQAQEFITKIETMSRLDLGLEKIAADFMNPKNIETIGQ